MTDLNRTDCYGDEIPDIDIETTLKVIRTIRNYYLHPTFFDADGAVILSYAHQKISELTRLAEEAEKAATISLTTVTTSPTANGPCVNHASSTSTPETTPGTGEARKIEVTTEREAFT